MTAAASDDVIVFEDRIRSRAGVAWFLNTVVRMTDSNATTIGIQMVSQDITSLKTTEESLRTRQLEPQTQNAELQDQKTELEAMTAKYVELYDKAPLSYFTLDGTGVIVEANLTAGVQLTVDRAALIRGSFSDFLQPEDQVRFYLYHRKLFLNPVEVSHDHLEAQMRRLHIRRPDGAVFPAILKAALTENHDGESVCRVVAVELISDHHSDHKGAGAA